MSERTPALPLSSLHNPFDFANPVSEKELFIGRNTEREDIAYYLYHAKTAPRTINIALLGERAAGKTSLLNIIEIEAKDRSLVPVRIDLNESDVESHLAFWFKLFDGIVNRVITEPAVSGDGYVFGGEFGRTYDTYLDLVTSYEIPVDKTFAPFLFPTVYAKSMAANNPNTRVSDHVLKRDLKLVSEEAGRPIVVMIDECNLLSANRALLEMVRNTFMNLKGFMLVFTGTPDLFPLMDEVFSPIVRQFKRIEVTPFASLKDTRDAVLEPLKSVGQDDLFKMPSKELVDEYSERPEVYRIQGELQDLHDLTGGRPYEIQLVCHFMFRRVQQQKDKRMRLSIDVLEDVLRELRQSHDVDLRPIISAVKKLGTDDLHSLDILLRSGGKIPLKELLFVAYVIGKTDKLPEDFQHCISTFAEAGILVERDGAVDFTGDDFDKIVCKYAARQRDVHLSFDPHMPKGLITSHIHRMGAYGGQRRERRGAFALARLLSSHPKTDDDRQGLVSRWPALDGTRLDVLGSKINSIILENYRIFVAGGTTVPSLRVFRVQITDPLVLDEFFYLLEVPEFSRTYSRIQQHLGELKERVEAASGAVILEEKPVAGCEVSELIDMIEQSGSQELMERCAATHAELMFDAYVGPKNREEALRHAMLAYQMRESLPLEDRTQVGYVLLASEHFTHAEAILGGICEKAPEDFLSRYNLGLTHLRLGKLSSARDRLSEVREECAKKEVENIAVLLFANATENGEVRFVERWTSDWEKRSTVKTILLSEAAAVALQCLETI